MTKVSRIRLGRARWQRAIAALLLAASVLSLAVVRPTGHAAAAPAASPADAMLASGAVLTSGQSLKSVNGQYKLAMQTDGNLVEYMRGLPLWATGTFGHPGAWLAMQGDGNLVEYGPGGVLWSTGTDGHPGSTLALQTDGNLVVYSAQQAPLWANGVSVSTLPSGFVLTRTQYLTSPNGQYQLVVQNDGNLVEYMGTLPVWASGTYGHPGAWLAMQGDGNLVIYTAGGQALWSSGTDNHPGARLTLQADANVVVYTPSNIPLWESGTVSNTLPGDMQLSTNQLLMSPNRSFELVMQADGNLVEYAGYAVVWSAGTAGHPYAWAAMQSDGNLVIYAGGVALWSSGTSGWPGAYLSVQSDGSVNVNGPGGVLLWSTASPANCTADNSCSPSTFAQLLLAEPKVNAPVTAPNVSAVSVWERAEGGGAGCPGQPPLKAPWAYSSGPAGNPLNTTQPDAGSQPTPWNDVGVQQYQNAAGHTCWYWGLYATYQTLVNGNYGPIITALRNPASTNHDQCVNLAEAVGKTPWGTGNFSADC